MGIIKYIMGGEVWAVLKKAIGVEVDSSIFHHKYGILGRVVRTCNTRNKRMQETRWSRRWVLSYVESYYRKGYSSSKE